MGGKMEQGVETRQIKKEMLKKNDRCRFRV